MSWNLTKSRPSGAVKTIANFITEFKETHLGPLKNSLAGRSTSTSTIKADAPAEPIDEKVAMANSNDIGNELLGEGAEYRLTMGSCFGSSRLLASSSDKARYLDRHSA